MHLVALAYGFINAIFLVQFEILNAKRFQWSEIDGDNMQCWYVLCVLVALKGSFTASRSLKQTRVNNRELIQYCLAIINNLSKLVKRYVYVICQFVLSWSIRSLAGWVVGATKTTKIGCIRQKTRNINHLELMMGAFHTLFRQSDLFKRTLSSKPFLN